MSHPAQDMCRRSCNLEYPCLTLAQVDESDPLLDDAQTVRYGAVGADEVAQPDEEELEREREALNRITMQATEYVLPLLRQN
jgi:hypothetical protein